MVNTRNYVRLLKHLGIALIFAPEPFTTPFGVALVLAARHVSKRHEASVNSRLRETVQYYLSHAGHSGDHVDDESGAPSPVKQRGLSEERPILGQITGRRSLGAESFVRQSRHGIQRGTANHAADIESFPTRRKYGHSLSATSTRTQNVIHHSIDTEWFPRRHESASGSVAHSSWATTSGGVEGVTHHSVNMGPLSQRYGTGNVEHAKAMSHATNTTPRRQPHGSAVSRTTVINALQNNNYYYEVLSRKNTIGGY